MNSRTLVSLVLLCLVCNLAYSVSAAAQLEAFPPVQQGKLATGAVAAEGTSGQASSSGADSAAAFVGTSPTVSGSSSAVNATESITFPASVPVGSAVAQSAGSAIGSTASQGTSLAASNTTPGASGSVSSGMAQRNATGTNALSPAAGSKISAVAASKANSSGIVSGTVPGAAGHVGGSAVQGSAGAPSVVIFAPSGTPAMDALSAGHAAAAQAMQHAVEQSQAAVSAKPAVGAGGLPLDQAANGTVNVQLGGSVPIVRM